MATVKAGAADLRGPPPWRGVSVYDRGEAISAFNALSISAADAARSNVLVDSLRNPFSPIGTIAAAVAAGFWQVAVRLTTHTPIGQSLGMPNTPGVEYGMTRACSDCR